MVGWRVSGMEVGGRSGVGSEVLITVEEWEEGEVFDLMGAVVRAS